VDGFLPNRINVGMVVHRVISMPGYYVEQQSTLVELRRSAETVVQPGPGSMLIRLRMGSPGDRYQPRSQGTRGECCMGLPSQAQLHVLHTWHF
jgi:hypothetical protein